MPTSTKRAATDQVTGGRYPKRQRTTLPPDASENQSQFTEDENSSPHDKGSKFSNGGQVSQLDENSAATRQSQHFVARSQIDVRSYEDDKPQVMRLKSLASDVVRVLVGPDEVAFTVHEGLLSFHSEFFRGALRGSFAESHDLLIRLPEEEPHEFDWFVQWLYRDHFSPQQPAKEKLTLRFGESIRYPQLKECAMLHVLADFLGCSPLKAELEAMLTRDQWAELPDADTIHCIWEKHTDKGSPFRKLVVDQFVNEAGGKCYGRSANYPGDFWRLVAYSQRELVKRWKCEACIAKRSLARHLPGPAHKCVCNGLCRVPTNRTNAINLVSGS